MTKAKVAVVYTKPATVLEDYDRLLDLAGVSQALAPNTPPWQLEGTIRALRARDFAELSCVQNKTVVTNAFKGEDLNGYVPIFRKYDIPVLFNFREEDIRWIRYEPR